MEYLQISNAGLVARRKPCLNICVVMAFVNEQPVKFALFSDYFSYQSKHMDELCPLLDTIEGNVLNVQFDAYNWLLEKNYQFNGIVQIETESSQTPCTICQRKGCLFHRAYTVWWERFKLMVDQPSHKWAYESKLMNFCSPLQFHFSGTACIAVEFDDMDKPLQFAVITDHSRCVEATKGYWIEKLRKALDIWKVRTILLKGYHTYNLLRNEFDNYKVEFEEDDYDNCGLGYCIRCQVYKGFRNILWKCRQPIKHQVLSIHGWHFPRCVWSHDDTTEGPDTCNCHREYSRIPNYILERDFENTN